MDLNKMDLKEFGRRAAMIGDARNVRFIARTACWVVMLLGILSFVIPPVQTGKGIVYLTGGLFLFVFYLGARHDHRDRIKSFARWLNEQPDITQRELFLYTPDSEELPEDFLFLAPKRVEPSD